MLPIPDPAPISKPKPRKPSVGGSIGKVVGGIGKKVGKKVRRGGGGRSSGGGSSSRRRSGGGGNSSGGGNFSNRGGGGNGGRNRVTTPERAPSVPKIPSIAQYLGSDSTYQNAIRSGQASLKDFLSEMRRRKGDAGTQFTQTTASMERDRVQQLEDLKNEFASRGLIQSGLYGEEQGEFQQKFTDQMNTLKQQQAALLADLLAQETGYKRENQQAIELAKQQALARRSAKHKIG